MHLNMHTLVLRVCNFVWISSFYCSVKSIVNPDSYSEDSLIPVHVTEPHNQRHLRNPAVDLTLKFHLSSKAVVLQFQQNTLVNPQIPVYKISKNGSFIRGHLFNNFEDTTYYYDPDNCATFSIQSVNGEQIRMYGTFHFGNEEYILEYRNTSTQQQHVEKKQSDIYRFNFRKIPINHEKRSNILTNLICPKNNKSQHPFRRTKRTPAYFVEVLFVVDYSVYKHWFDKSLESTQERKDADAKKSIHQFYAFVVNSMDGMFRSISPNFMAVASAGIFISETPSDSPWSENYKIFSAAMSRYFVNPKKCMAEFRKWVKKQKNFPEYDHAMLTTRYGLNNATRAFTLGSAIVGGMCSFLSQSIITEMDDDYGIMKNAAHELGHSLGAGHNVNKSECTEGDYIMGGKRLKNPGPWRFSSCSVKSFKRLIQKLDAKGKNCLKSFGSSYNPNAIDSYLTKLPGQLYSADEQCVRRMGTGSSMCRVFYKGDYRRICEGMYCAFPDKRACAAMIPADGTLCANKHWCRYGVCSYSSQAPALPDNCVHGEFVGDAYHGKTCAQIGSDDKTKCYIDRIANRCCESCAKVSSGVTGCLYGDRIPSSSCNSSACPYYSKEELRKCCHTCSSYFIVPTTPTMPTESDGTNEILIGITVAVVLVAVGVGIWLDKKRQVTTKRTG